MHLRTVGTYEVKGQRLTVESLKFKVLFEETKQELRGLGLDVADYFQSAENLQELVTLLVQDPFSKNIKPDLRHLIPELTVRLINKGTLTKSFKAKRFVLAKVKTEDILDLNFRIYLNVDEIMLYASVKGSAGLLGQLVTTINHELTHLINGVQNQFGKKVEKRLNKLEKASKRTNIAFFKTHLMDDDFETSMPFVTLTNQFYISFRQVLIGFQMLVFEEGLARFNEKFSQDLQARSAGLYYKRAVTQAKIVIKRSNLVLNLLSLTSKSNETKRVEIAKSYLAQFEKEINSTSYAIGFYIYLRIFANQLQTREAIDLVELLKIKNPVHLIRLYEQVETEKKVISLKDKSAIICFRDLVGRANQERKRLIKLAEEENWDVAA